MPQAPDLLVSPASTRPLGAPFRKSPGDFGSTFRRPYTLHLRLVGHLCGRPGRVVLKEGPYVAEGDGERHCPIIVVESYLLCSCIVSMEHGPTRGAVFPDGPEHGIEVGEPTDFFVDIKHEGDYTKAYPYSLGVCVRRGVERDGMSLYRSPWRAYNDLRVSTEWKVLTARVIVGWGLTLVFAVGTLIYGFFEGSLVLLTAALWTWITAARTYYRVSRWSRDDTTRGASEVCVRGEHTRAEGT